MFKLILILLFSFFFNLNALQSDYLNNDEIDILVKKQYDKILAKAEYEQKLVATGYVIPLKILLEFDPTAKKDTYLHMDAIYDLFFRAAKKGNL